MKNLIQNLLSVSMITSAILTGCIPVDENEVPEPDNCLPRISSEEVCESQGLEYVGGCPRDGRICFPIVTEDRCGGRVTVLCTEKENECDEEFAIDPADVCQSRGLELATEDECYPPSIAVMIEPTGAQETEEYHEGEARTENGIEDTDDEADDEGFTTKCIEPEPVEPSEQGCVEIEVGGACGEPEFVLCKGPAEPVCPDLYDPVCGVDGETYANSCLAAGVPIEHRGACEPQCSFIYEPVCGTDGVTYGNRCAAGNRAIAYDGECQEELTGTCISEGILHQQSQVKLFVDSEPNGIYAEEGEARTSPIEETFRLGVMVDAGYWFPSTDSFLPRPQTVAHRLIRVNGVRVFELDERGRNNVIEDEQVGAYSSERLTEVRTYELPVDERSRLFVEVELDTEFATCTLIGSGETVGLLLGD